MPVAIYLRRVGRRRASPPVSELVPLEGATVCKLKVVVQIRSTQHDAVEPVVVLEPSNLHEAKSLAVHIGRAVEGADWSSDSELGWHDPEVGERSNVPSHRRATAAACRSAMLHARPGALGG